MYDELSCVFWGIHIIPQDNCISPSLTFMIESFFNSKLLDWRYMVSFQGSIDTAIIMLRRLISIKSQVYSKIESFPHPVVTMGLDMDWPSTVTIQMHHIKICRLSPSEDTIFAHQQVGGHRDKIAVYSTWDIRTGDGTTFVHPCKTQGCSVIHVSIHQECQNGEFRTGCKCGVVCRWGISPTLYFLKKITRLGPKDIYEYWSEDGTKALYRPKKGAGTNSLGRLCIAGTPPVHHDLGTHTDHEERPYPFGKWMFSPGSGDKILLFDPLRVLDIWECASGRQLFQQPYHAFLNAQFSPDGTSIACINLGNALELISAEDGSVLYGWDRIIGAHNILFSIKENKLVIWSENKIYSIDGKMRHQVDMEDCKRVFISSDGQKIAVILSKHVDIYDISFQRIEHYDLSNLIYNSHNYLSWTHSILVSDADGHGSIIGDTISLHNIASNTKITASSHDVHEFHLSPDSCHLLTLHKDRSICLWDVKSGQRLHTFDSHHTNFSRRTHIEYAPDSSCAFLLDSNSLILLWTPPGVMQSISLLIFSDRESSATESAPNILSAAFFPNSTRILVLKSNGNMTGHSLDGIIPHPIPPLQFQVEDVRKFVISPTGHLAAICCKKGLIVHGIAEHVHQMPLLSRSVQSVVFSPDGTHVYGLIHSAGKWAIASVDTLRWTTHRISASEGYLGVPLIGYGRLHIVTGNGWLTLRCSYDMAIGNQNRFFKIPTGKQSSIAPLTGHFFRANHQAVIRETLQICNFLSWPYVKKAARTQTPI
ncbi:YVTN repeat-like/Quino protein amine dehydrogenase [Serendipita vermifera]|nr:YVTN repeat-like/Quino protein amine dehydrogenase [Serendipita vermifera]